MQEDRMNRAKPFFRGEKSRFTSRTQSEGASSSTITKPTPTLPPVKKISWEEIQKRREKGLCFSCNERFTPGHLCAIKQLFVFDAEGGGNKDWTRDNPATEETDEDTGDSDLQISLHALVGYTGPRTMRVAGRIGCRRVPVLIDSGSTHNFIDQRLARHLALSVTLIDQFWVTVANGEKLSCKEKHEEAQPESHSSVADEIQAILDDLSTVLEVPTSLPPSREFDLHIQLKAGPDSINVRPYKYAHFQKNELEPQITEMLESGLIRLNASGTGIGVVLAQQGRPLAYMSKAIGPKKQGWSVYSKEMLAVMEAIRLWRPYLLG
ncbi:hypothetical protein F0562_007956 [Nyssa sinensis]|uniref:Reverse transcriptase RNase H-like domain-containing protein n=1 Tax=Nyssa sinensis TaxID=561372 RepID=A0A5J5A6X1_9ASTE|nr:hypothetical protein F0562_007956 [Nyssa sinensis]